MPALIITTTPPRTRLLRPLIASLPLLLAAACDNSTPADVATTTAPTEPPITLADLHGDWIVHPSFVRDAIFNVLLTQSISAGQDPTDPEIEQQVTRYLPDFNANPVVYTFNPGGGFSAISGTNTATGDWTLEGDTVTVNSTSKPKPILLRLTRGLLINLGTDPRHRPIHLVRKE